MIEKKKIEVNAILDTEIETLLMQTSQYDDLINDKIICKSCGTIINQNNIGIIIPIKSNTKMELEFYCEKINCMDEYGI